MSNGGRKCVTEASIMEDDIKRNDELALHVSHLLPCNA
jgi:hypothetical protein